MVSTKNIKLFSTLIIISISQAPNQHMISEGSCDMLFLNCTISEMQQLS